MPAEISIVQVTPRPLTVVRITTVLSTWPKQFMHTLNKVYALVKTGQVRQNGHKVMVYRSREDGRVDIECGVEIEGGFDPIGEVAYSETPSGLVVTIAHIRPYDELGMSHSSVIEWSGKNGHQLSGTRWEIYGDWHEDPAKLRTDIFYLVRP